MRLANLANLPLDSRNARETCKRFRQRGLYKGKSLIATRYKTFLYIIVIKG